MFNIKKYLIDRGINYDTEGKNVSRGWVNIACPFCNDTSNHGGFNLNQNYYNCWKCGFHSLYDVIMELDHVSFYEAKKIYEQYSDVNEIITEKKKKLAKEIQLPQGGGDLNKRHRKYLESRDFDPNKLEKIYKLKGTTYYGNFKFRIIVPIFFDGILVSYQGRDYTGKNDIRYKNCPVEQEIIRHKNILYNIDNAKKDEVIIVEGVTDVWRLGHNSIATFGIEYTKAQLNLIRKRFKNIFICFDSEIKAQEKAVQLANDLSSLGCGCENIHLEDVNDIGDMKQTDADYLMKELNLL